MANQNRKRQPRRQPSRSSTPVDYDDYDDAADDTNFEVDGYPDEETELEEDQFERFRKRAQALPIKEVKTRNRRTVLTRKPFVLGADYGFDPAIKIQAPTYVDRLRLEQILKDPDQLSSIDVLRLIFKDNLNRFIMAINDAEDAEMIALGVIVAYFEHFYGKGLVEKITDFSTLLL